MSKIKNKLKLGFFLSQPSGLLVLRISNSNKNNTKTYLHCSLLLPRDYNYKFSINTSTRNHVEKSRLFLNQISWSWIFCCSNSLEQRISWKKKSGRLWHALARSHTHPTKITQWFLVKIDIRVISNVFVVLVVFPYFMYFYVRNFVSFHPSTLERMRL